jgi:antitoxin (DNA-binding transcriptional repressor) of toxin-antitoxin stability system
MIDVQDLPAQLTEVVKLASAGTEVIVTEGNVPRAMLVPLPSGRPRVLGLHEGSMQIADDFDDPLPDDFWTGGT